MYTWKQQFSVFIWKKWHYITGIVNPNPNYFPRHELHTLPLICRCIKQTIKGAVRSGEQRVGSFNWNHRGGICLRRRPARWPAREKLDPTQALKTFHGAAFCCCCCCTRLTDRWMLSRLTNKKRVCWFSDMEQKLILFVCDFPKLLFIGTSTRRESLNGREVKQLLGSLGYTYGGIK